MAAVFTACKLFWGVISAEGERSEFGRSQGIMRHFQVVFGRNFDECIILLGVELFFCHLGNVKGL